VVAGDREIDCCTACGALWFDYGEIRELTEGRLSVDAEGGPPPAPTGMAATAEKPGAILSRMRREGAFLACPRCGAALTAIDFQLTGIPVFQCPSCEGILAPRASAAGIAARFRFLREHGSRVSVLGETLARREKRRMESEYGRTGPGTGVSMAVPLPLVVPLADDSPGMQTLPLATISLIAASAVFYLAGQVRGEVLALPGGLTGLPSGTGFAGVPKMLLLLAPFFHAGILPLVAGSLFLLVLGDNVEDRMGPVAYLVFYLFCGACAGAAHVLWGKIGEPAASGSAGAVAGILGAYLVFFPSVSIRMYGMGRIVTLPAYLFACAWLIAVFFLGPAGPLASLVDPARLSLPGNLAGFGTGVLGAILWRFCEQPLR
jgi:membrane associated rhomboid family serine protease